MDEKTEEYDFSIYNKRESNAIAFPAAWQCCERYMGWVCGGHFEENELNDPKACVLRELKEELG